MEWWRSTENTFYGADNSPSDIQAATTDAKWPDDGSSQETVVKRKKPLKAKFVIGDRHCTINLTISPYFAGMSHFYQAQEKAGIFHHWDFPDASLILLGINSGPRHYFKRLGTDLDVYRRLFDILEPYGIATGPWTMGELADEIFTGGRFDWPHKTSLDHRWADRDWAFACLAYIMTRYKPCKERKPRTIRAIVMWVTGNPNWFNLVERQVFLKMWLEMFKPGSRRMNEMERFIRRQNDSERDVVPRLDWFGALREDWDSFEAVDWDVLEISAQKAWMLLIA